MSNMRSTPRTAIPSDCQVGGFLPCADRTGTRVPRETGTPCIVSGSLVTARVMSSLSLKTGAPQVVAASPRRGPQHHQFLRQRASLYRSGSRLPIQPTRSEPGRRQRFAMSCSSCKVWRIGCITACSSIASMEYSVCHRDRYSGVSSRSSGTSWRGGRQRSSKCSM